MSNIKNVFTTKDLESISGIKAHTIRAWVSRYKLFAPERASRNIQYYSLESLQKLLNIALLNRKGLKISKIAILSEIEIISKTRTFVNGEIKNDFFCNQLKIAMYRFDSDLFEQIYQQAIQTNSFSQLFQDIFVPFLHFLGLAWQTDSIMPAHERFISNLIYQKLLLNTAQLESGNVQSDNRTFVLFLPEEEMHEIGLLYLNYELKLRGYRTVYLGRSIPLENLMKLKSLFPLIYWISIFTITPSPKISLTFLNNIETLLAGTPHHYWAIGQNLSATIKGIYPANMNIFSSADEILPKL